MAGVWNQVANLGSQGGGSSASANPILSDVGILVYKGTVNNTDIHDFVVAGEQDVDNSDGSVTFRFKMPYNGWFLGYTFTGLTSVPMQIGSYVSRLEPDGTGTDIVHVDPSTLQPMQLQHGGIQYMDPNPPQISKDELVAMKVNFGSNNGGQNGDITAFAYLHFQYDPASVAATAALQTQFTRAPVASSPQETEVAFLDLGHFYAKDGEAPTSNSQLVDTYVDKSDNSSYAVNNSRFAPFNCQVTSAAISQQTSLTTGLSVIIHTQGGDIGPMRIEAGQAHTELTISPAINVSQGGYFYAECFADSASTGQPMQVSCLATIVPA